MWKTIKGALKSKTVWFNVLTGALEIVNVLNGNIIPASVAVPIVTIGNVIIRVIWTNKPVAEK